MVSSGRSLSCGQGWPRTCYLAQLDLELDGYPRLILILWSSFQSPLSIETIDDCTTTTALNSSLNILPIPITCLDQVQYLYHTVTVLCPPSILISHPCLNTIYCRHFHCHENADHICHFGFVDSFLSNMPTLWFSLHRRHPPVLMGCSLFLYFQSLLLLELQPCRWVLNLEHNPVLSGWMFFPSLCLH